MSASDMARAWWSLTTSHAAPDGAKLLLSIRGFPSQGSAQRFVDGPVRCRLIAHRGRLHFVTPSAALWLVPFDLMTVDGLPLTQRPPTWLESFAVMPVGDATCAPYEPVQVDPYVCDLLRRVDSAHGRDLKALRREHLDNCARWRRGLSEEEVRARRLDVYPRAGRSFDSLVAAALKDELLAEAQEGLTLTLHGREALLLHELPDGHDGFERWCGTLGGKPYQPMVEPSDTGWLIRGYQGALCRDGEDLQPTADELLRERLLKEHILAHNPAVGAEVPLPRMLHVHPQLYLAGDVFRTRDGRSLAEHARAQLDLAIICNDIDVMRGAEVRIVRPWPNRCYFVADVLGHGEGWFVPIPCDLKATAVHLVWQIPSANVRVLHTVRYHFVPGAGPLYGSACQSAFMLNHPWSFAGSFDAALEATELFMQLRLRGTATFVEAVMRNGIHVTTIRDEVVLRGAPLVHYRPSWLRDQRRKLGLPFTTFQPDEAVG